MAEKRERMDVNEMLWAHQVEGVLDPLAAQRIIGIQLLEMAVRNYNLLNDVMDRMDTLEARLVPQKTACEGSSPKRVLTKAYEGDEGC